MITQWNEKYRLHCEKIDFQHQELFRLSALIENLNEKTTKKETEELLNKFFIYMEEHFRDEEIYMAKIDYPLLSKHHQLHLDIIEQFSNLIKECHTLESLQGNMKKATKKWLVEHISQNDLKMEKWNQINI